MSNISNEPSTCLTADDLSKQLNISTFNKMMNNTANKVTEFVNSYIEKQDNIKNKQQEQSLDLNRYKQTALDVRRKMVEKHQELIKQLNREFDILTTQVQSLKNTKELNKMLKKQNDSLKKDVENQVHTIEISDRKTYYENEQNSIAEWWSHHFQTKYKYLILLLILGIVITNRYKEFKLWGIIIALALYPPIAFFVLDIIEKIWRWIRANSRLVYLHSDM